jgi:hypothetical protein
VTRDRRLVNHFQRRQIESAYRITVAVAGEAAIQVLSQCNTVYALGTGYGAAHFPGFRVENFNMIIAADE